MPVWDFRCNECGRIESDVAGPKCDPDLYRPDCCDKPMVELYVTHAVAFFEPFTTQHMDPNFRPITISSKKELTRYEREFGVRRVDDPHLVSRGGELVREVPTGRKFYT